MNRADKKNAEAAAAFFAALGQPTRLLLLRLIWHEALSGERLTELSGLSAGTVSHHLAELRRAGLVQSEQSGYWRLHRARTAALRLPLEGLVKGQVAPPAPNRADSAAEANANAPVQYGKVQRLPRKADERQAVLATLARDFEAGREYTETEVLLRLQGHQPTPSALRRALVKDGWLTVEGGLHRVAEGKSG